jgi:hypothetical protein
MTTTHIHIMEETSPGNESNRITIVDASNVPRIGDQVQLPSGKTAEVFKVLHVYSIEDDVHTAFVSTRKV